MIYYSSPPAIPVPIYSSDCERGSRDCFPEDTVGGYLDDRSIPTPVPDLRSYSPLLSTFPAGDAQAGLE